MVDAGGQGRHRGTDTGDIAATAAIAAITATAATAATGARERPRVQDSGGGS
jgi:hypothetical protein